MSAPLDFPRPQSVRDADLLMEQRAFEQRVLREGGAADWAAQVDTMSRPVTCAEIEAVVCELDADPRKIAERLIELERGAALMRCHLETLELRGVR